MPGDYIKNDYITKKRQERSKQILDLYESGISIPKMAKELGSSEERLRKALSDFKKAQKEANETILKHILYKRVTNIKAKESRKIYALVAINNVSQEKVAYIYDIDVEEIKSILSNTRKEVALHNNQTETQQVVQENEESKKKGKKVKIGIPEEVLQEMIERYNDWEPINSFAEEYGYEPSFVWHEMRKVNPDIATQRLNELLNSKAEEIKEKYESGDYMPDRKNAFSKGSEDIIITNIAREYKNIDGIEGKDISRTQIKQLLKTIYGERGIPRILSKENLLRAMQTSKKEDKLQIRDYVIDIAKEGNFIIPKKFMDEVFGKEIDQLNIKQILQFYGDLYKYYIEQVKPNEMNIETEEKIITEMKKRSNIIELMKTKELDSRCQAILLLYSLKKVSALMNNEVSDEQINDLANNDTETLEALKLLNTDEEDFDTHIENLKDNETAKNVKLAIILEEYKQLLSQGKELDIYEKFSYLELAKGTVFEEEFNAIRNYKNNQPPSSPGGEPR